MLRRLHRPGRAELPLPYRDVGIVNALGFGVAASLLRAIALQSWADIGHLAAIVALRTVLKRSFASLTFDVESGLTSEGAASRQGTA